MENEENKVEELNVTETVALDRATEEEKVAEEDVKDGAEVKDEPEAVSEEVETPQTEVEREEVEQEPQEETVHPDGDNDNKKDEETGEAVAEEEVEELEQQEKAEKEEEIPEQKQEEIPPEQAELLAQLKELRAEKEEQEALRNCNEQVMKVEQEFQVCSDRIAQALQESFAQNDIDPTKTLEELKKENPAKATLAMQFIKQAQELKTQLEDAAVKEISKHQNEVIYRAAAREFEKVGLNLEQAKEAVKTFKRIVNEIGIADLKEDLQMKVQLAAGRAMLLKPQVEEQTPEDKMAKPDSALANEESDTTEIKEASPENEEVVKSEKVKEEKEVPPTPVIEKPKVEDFEEGVAGKASVGAGTMINELNVLEELAKLPYKERAKFYKEHEDTIAKALSRRG